MAGGTKRLPRAVREQQMLDAAVQMFSVNGYHETSMDAIAAQAARAEHFGDFGEVLVLPLAGQNLVANDDGAKGTTHSRSPSIVTSAPPRERRRASSP